MVRLQPERERRLTEPELRTLQPERIDATVLGEVEFICQRLAGDIQHRVRFAHGAQPGQEIRAVVAVTDGRVGQPDKNRTPV